MSKRKSSPDMMGDLFGQAPKTPPEPAPAAPAGADPEPDHIRRLGVGLKGSDIDRLDELAGRFNTSRHALLKFAVLHLLAQVDRGDLDLADHVDKRRRNRLSDPR